jgi:hypothetical protein
MLIFRNCFRKFGKAKEKMNERRLGERSVGAVIAYSHRIHFINNLYSQEVIGEIGIS